MTTDAHGAVKEFLQARYAFEALPCAQNGFDAECRIETKFNKHYPEFLSDIPFSSCAHLHNLGLWTAYEYAVSVTPQVNGK